MNTIELNINSEYNKKYGNPFIVVDRLLLESNSDYIIEIKCLLKNYPYILCPVFKAIEPNAYFLLDKPAISLYGKKNKRVKMYASVLDSEEMDSFLFHTDSGNIEILFECEYYDEINHIMTRERGHIAKKTLMTRRIISENKLEYRCCFKDNMELNNLVFTIEWTKL